MPVYVDQMQREVWLKSTPKRIVSTVPSQTELLAALGLDNEVVGITKFCVHPEAWHRTKTRVGGTKNLNLDQIRELKPDLIFANKEENDRTQIERLANDFPVYVSDVTNLPGACRMMEDVGRLTGTEAKAFSIVRETTQNFSILPDGRRKKRCAYLIWKDPYMTVGGDTFIHDLLQRAGFENVFGTYTRYPQITLPELSEAGCELVFLSSEPYPFKQKHVEELQALLPGAVILLVDGEMFSWYGSRLIKVPAYITSLQKKIGALQ